MKHIVVIDIDAPQDAVADLYSDPSKNTQWMDDVERYEPVSGKQGMPGSKYRLIPKRGSMLFTATVVERELPRKLRLKLDSSSAVVEMRGTLSSLPGGRTRLTSEEVVSFKGDWHKFTGLFARPAIRWTHRKHIQAFKKFVERQKRDELQ